MLHDPTGYKQIPIADCLLQTLTNSFSAKQSFCLGCDYIYRKMFPFFITLTIIAFCILISIARNRSVYSCSMPVRLLLDFFRVFL